MIWNGAAGNSNATEEQSKAMEWLSEEAHGNGMAKQGGAEERLGLAWNSEAMDWQCEAGQWNGAGRRIVDRQRNCMVQ